MVLSEARALDADMIVIGAAFPSGARPVLHMPLLEKADRPVLVVPNL